MELFAFRGCAARLVDIAMGAKQAVYGSLAPLTNVFGAVAARQSDHLAVYRYGFSAIWKMQSR